MRPLFSFGYGGCLQECVCGVPEQNSTDAALVPAIISAISRPRCVFPTSSRHVWHLIALSPQSREPLLGNRRVRGGGQGLSAQLKVSLVCQFALIPQEVTRDHHWPWLGTLRNLWRTFKICHLPIRPLSYSLDTAGFMWQGSQLSLY